jgi:hypothetical protein
MAKPTYDQVLKSVKQLELRSQRRLLTTLKVLVETRVRKKHSIMELRGLGKEIWKGIDAQDYVDRERDSWGG